MTNSNLQKLNINNNTNTTSDKNDITTAAFEQ